MFFTHKDMSYPVQSSPGGHRFYTRHLDRQFITDYQTTSTKIGICVSTADIHHPKKLRVDAMIVVTATMTAMEMLARVKGTG